MEESVFIYHSNHINPDDLTGHKLRKLCIDVFTKNILQIEYL